MATIKKSMKKAQKGLTMKQLIKKYPGTDTTAAGDTRFQEYNAYAPKKFMKQLEETDAAFDKKYGKGKPAVDKTTKKKGKMGVSVKKKMQAGGVAGKSVKAPMVDPKGAYTKVQMRTLGNMKKGGSMKKANFGDILKTISPVASGIAGLFGKKKKSPMQSSTMGTMMKKGGKMSKKK